MRVRFSRAARRHVADILTYLAKQNPSAAERVSDDIAQALSHLRTAPTSGRPGVAPRTREWVMTRRPYIIVDRIEDEGSLMTVLAVYHTARRRP